MRTLQVYGVELVGPTGTVSYLVAADDGLAAKRFVCEHVAAPPEGVELMVRATLALIEPVLVADDARVPFA